MGKFKIEDLKKEFADLGWELKSDKYTNLTTQMEMVCPNGHTVYTTYEKFRKSHICPICARQNLEQKANIETIPKRKGVYRTLVFDQATHTSGWSIFDDENLLRYGTFNTKPNEPEIRIAEFKNYLINMMEFWKPDRIVIEDIQLQQFGPKNSDNVEGVTTFKTLAHLQGVIINTLVENNMDYLVAHTGTWRTSCGIKGRTRVDRKKSAQLLVKEVYGVDVSNDEADAICIGMYAVKKRKVNNQVISWE